MNRYHLLLRRMRLANQLGFRFLGTTHTQLPRNMKLLNRRIALSYPDDPTLIGDVINIFLDDEYGIRSIRSPVETVVDVGANIGLFSLWARHHFPDATIHAYEPNDKIWSYAGANLKEANVRLFNEGVSNEDATASLVMRESSRGVATKRDAHGNVKLTGIKTVLQRIGGKIDLLKIDCEGAEWDIFLTRSAFRNVRQIRMEYHLNAGREIADLQSISSNLGFQITRLVPNRNFGIAWLDNVESPD